MATLKQIILRPSSDITVAHTMSAGQNGFTLINEEVPDNELTTLYKTEEEASDGSKIIISRFNCTANNIPNKFYLKQLQTTLITANDTQLRPGNRNTVNVYSDITPLLQINDDICSNLQKTVLVDQSETGNTTLTIEPEWTQKDDIASCSLYDTIMYNTDFNCECGFGTTSYISGTIQKNGKTRGLSTYVTNMYVTMSYYDVYDCVSLSGEGIDSTSVSSSEVVDEDICTFDCNVHDGYRFYGWFSNSTNNDTFISFDENDLDGVKAVATTEGKDSIWIAGFNVDGQDINTETSDNWLSTFAYGYVLFEHASGFADNVYYIHFVNEAGNIYTPTGDWHDNTGILNITTDGNLLFIGGKNNQNGQDGANLGLWQVIYNEEHHAYTIGNIGRANSYIYPGSNSVSDQPVYVKLVETLRMSPDGFSNLVSTDKVYNATITENTTLLAKAKLLYNVNFVMTNSICEVDYIQGIDGEIVTIPEASAEDGYRFLGWYDNINGYGEPISTGSFNYTISAAVGNITIYAVSKQVYIIKAYNDENCTLNSNMLYGLTGNIVTFEVTSVTDGYAFAGWYKRTESGEIRISTNPVLDVTIGEIDEEYYAKSIEGVIIRIFGDDNVNVTDDIYTPIGEFITITASVTDPEYVFKGWYVNDVLVSNSLQYTFEATSSFDIYAKSTLKTTIFVKQHGTWVKAREVYKKINGSWVKQDALENAFDPNTKYKIMNYERKL